VCPSPSHRGTVGGGGRGGGELSHGKDWQPEMFKLARFPDSDCRHEARRSLTESTGQAAANLPGPAATGKLMGDTSNADRDRPSRRRRDSTSLRPRLPIVRVTLSQA
jgi:hypothetical protein